MPYSLKDKIVYDFRTFTQTLDLASQDDAGVLAEHTRTRVQDALCGVAEIPGDVLEIRQALIDDLTAAPAACLPVALAELHAITACLFGRSDEAWTSFRLPGVEGRRMADELAALAHNPYRYVGGGLCEHAGSMVEHLATVFALVQVMVLAWPVEGCPICSYFDCDGLGFDDEVDDEPSLDDRTATATA
jgi:hypothetical protein